jgi:hypothetical protein
MANIDGQATVVTEAARSAGFGSVQEMGAAGARFTACMVRT